MRPGGPVYPPRKPLDGTGARAHTGVMVNDDERDEQEEEYNRRLLEDEAEEPYADWLEGPDEVPYADWLERDLGHTERDVDE